MAVGPDVYRVHQHDTERYVLTNLNLVSPDASGSGSGVLAGGLPSSAQRVWGPLLCSMASRAGGRVLGSKDLSVLRPWDQGPWPAGRSLGSLQGCTQWRSWGMWWQGQNLGLPSGIGKGPLTGVLPLCPGLSQPRASTMANLSDMLPGEPQSGVRCRVQG